MKEARPGVRVAVYDHMFVGDRAWFRFTFRWRDPNSNQAVTQAGMQSYRLKDGKLAETWIVLQPLGSTWPDPVAQEHWTSPVPGNEGTCQIRLVTLDLNSGRTNERGRQARPPLVMSEPTALVARFSQHLGVPDPGGQIRTAPESGYLIRTVISGN